MIQKKLTKNLILFLFLVIVYSIGNNIFYLSAAYADLPNKINKIENCKNEKIVKKAISKDNGFAIEGTGRFDSNVEIKIMMKDMSIIKKYIKLKFI